MKGRLGVHERPIFEINFVTFIENSSIVANGTQGSRKYQQKWN